MGAQAGTEDHPRVRSAAWVSLRKHAGTRETGNLDYSGEESWRTKTGWEAVFTTYSSATSHLTCHD